MKRNLVLVLVLSWVLGLPAMESSMLVKDEGSSHKTIGERPLHRPDEFRQLWGTLPREIQEKILYYVLKDSLLLSILVKNSSMPSHSVRGIEQDSPPSSFWRRLWLKQILYEQRRYIKSAQFINSDDELLVALSGKIQYTLLNSTYDLMDPKNPHWAYYLGKIKICDAKRGECLKQRDIVMPFWGDAKYYSVGNSLIICTAEGVVLWNPTTEQETLLLEKQEFKEVQLNHAQGNMLIVSRRNCVSLWDVSTLTCLHKFESKYYKNAFLSKEGDKIAIIGFSWIKVYDVSSGQMMLEVTHAGGPGWINARKNPFNASGDKLITATGVCTDRSLQVWDLAGDGRCILTCNYSNDDHHTLGYDFTPDGERVLTYYHGFVAHLWSFQGGLQPIRFNHGAWISEAHFNEFGDRLITASKQAGKVKVWDVERGECRAILNHKGVCSANFSKSEEKIITQSDSAIKVWNGQTYELLFTLNGKGRIESSCINEKETKMVTVSRLKSADVVDVWNIDKGLQMQKYCRAIPQDKLWEALVSEDLLKKEGVLDNGAPTEQVLEEVYEALPLSIQKLVSSGVRNSSLKSYLRTALGKVSSCCNGKQKTQ